MSQCKVLWFDDHKFDPWKIVDQLQITRGSDSNVVGKVFVQTRKCSKCGLTEITKHKVMYL